MIRKKRSLLRAGGNTMAKYVKNSAKTGLPKNLKKRLEIIYRILALVMVVLLFVMLFVMVLDMPAVGYKMNPDNNEVAKRYIESGLEETGAVNIVSGMILDYRAFDTFGESNVLFVATICVTIMLRLDGGSEKDDKSGKDDASGDDGKDDEDEKIDYEDGIKSVKRRTGREVSRARRVEKLKKHSISAIDSSMLEPMHDTILQKCSKIIIPVILVFGVYIVLNGHISPGGGFSGGAVLGAGFILYLSAYGFEKTERFMNATVIKWVTFCSLLVYCLAKSYSFFTGANGLESGIPLGTPGAILSSGLILVLNICVGMVVACTMYSFYALVRRGRI